MQRIDSSDNKRLKRLASLKKKKVRLEENLFLIEGLKMILEAREMNIPVDMVLVTESFLDHNAELCNALDSAYDVYVTSERNMGKCSSFKTPPGIMASVPLVFSTIGDMAAQKKPIVILDGVKDPGNMGTIIRTADAFGFGGVIMLPGCTDPFSPKAVQSTMGSVFRVRCADCVMDDIDSIRDSGYSIYGMDMDGKPLSGESFADGIPAVVIGSESHGLSEGTREMCDGFISIEMSGNAESLNASIAAAITMYRISTAGLT